MNSVGRFMIGAIGLPIWFAAIGMSQETNAQWTAPKNPDPQAILWEAEADSRAGRYEDALAKHLWYHENALKIQPAQYGVRLSFALGNWIDLGKKYPPALEKLKSIRDDDEREIRQGESNRDLFHDFKSINEYLGDWNRTKDTFVWLDTNAPAFAERVFEVAEPDLIKAKEYRLCGKYLHPDESFKRIQELYEMQLKIAKDDYARKSFSNKSATLVALLVVNGRKEDAERISAKAEKILKDQQFKALLEKAKKGEIPEPWP